MPRQSDDAGEKARVALTTKFARRPKFNTTGDNIKVGVNQFRVRTIPDKDIFQFDVSATPVGTRKTNEPIKDIVYKKCWESKVFQAQLKALGYPIIYDGAKLAWAAKDTEIRCLIDLDVEKGKPAREDKTNEFRFQVKATKKIRLACLTSYLGSKMTWDTSVTECMNFLDHLLRQGPSENFKLIKRSFFNSKSQTSSLGSCVEAIKGIYSAIRMNESISIQGLTGLGVNVDVSNQAFWVGQPLHKLAVNYIAMMSSGNGPRSEADLAVALRPVRGGAGASPAFADLKRLARLRFVTTHRKDGKNEEYTIAKFTGGPDYGAKGATAHTVKFDRRDPKDKTKTISTTVFDYYLSEFGMRLQYPDLPLVETGKGAYFPMEVCRINRLNSYPFKLDGQQTTQMLRFAVKKPGPRKEEILSCVQNLGWDKDPYLKSFGIGIDSSMPMVPAKLLKNPKLVFKKDLNPGMSGRWMLSGQGFSEPNPVPLKSWAVGVFESACDKDSIDKWISAFVTVYKGHGARIVNPTPHILAFNNTRTREEYGASIQRLYTETGQKFQAAPQIMFFIVRNKVSHPYEILKCYADTVLGVPSQVLLGKHIGKPDPQYMSNVSMKVNAKLGGTTNRAVQAAATPKATPLVPPKTAMIGVDVSHSAPGAIGASLASMCLSMDKDCVFYTGAVQTNGYRVEILTPENVHEMLEPLLREWVIRNKVTGPDNIFYFRDGVSEGQFAHVIDFELAEMRKVFQKVMQKVPKITVIVATKRHHIRFFPERGDKSGNPFPGTLVEKEVTHPFHYDFYLCSHVAIQGTARPVHYNVIHDEVKMTADDLQRMIYFQCYQYVRSTTPVSLHPAVYYAHLAGNRGRCHEMVGAAPQPLKKAGSQATTVMPPAPKLRPMGRNAHPSQRGALQRTMWYI